MTDTATQALSQGVGTWSVDPAASSVRFTHATMWGLVKVKGTFSGVTGSGQIDAGGTAAGRLEIQAASLDTGHSKRDKHLRGSDFFEVDAYPSITFTARQVTADSDAQATVTGDLEVHGRSRPITVPVRVTAATPEAVSLEAHLAIDRADFGLDWNKAGMIKGPATLDVTVRFVKQG